MTAYSRERGHRVRGCDPDTSGKDPAVICLRLHPSGRSPGTSVNRGEERRSVNTPVFTPGFTQLTDRTCKGLPD